MNAKNESPSARKQLQESILDWFDRNPAAKVRCAPLARALKTDATRLGEALATLAEPDGPLLRCKVEVGEKDRTPGAPKYQWEYCLAAGGKVAAAVKPYSPPPVFRRETAAAESHARRSLAPAPAAAKPDGMPAESAAAPHPAGNEDNRQADNPGAQPADTPAPAPAGSEPGTGQPCGDAPAGKADALPAALEHCDEALAALADDVNTLSERLHLAEGQRDAWRAAAGSYGCDTPSALLDRLEATAGGTKNDAAQAAEIAAKARRIADLEAELQTKQGTPEQLRADNEALRTTRPAAAAASFAVAQSGAPLQRCSKEAAARAAALAAARAGHTAEVFALFPLGKAIPGAEWKPSAKPSPAPSGNPRPTRLDQKFTTGAIVKPFTPETLPAIGAVLDGGFYAGCFCLDNGQAYALVVAPKAAGEHPPAIWIGDHQAVTGATSYNDGLANTLAMADAGSGLARWARGLTLGGFDDWYLPSQDELEIAYRNLKPTSAENYCWGRSGINLSAGEPTRPYTPTVPVQTSAPAFQDGGEQAFESAWYWSSTQDAADSAYAWGQSFGHGNQGCYDTNLEGRVRAVRRLKI